MITQENNSRIESGSEAGSISLLLIGLMLVLLLVASVIVGITTVYLEQKQLQDFADQTAQAVSNEVRGLSGADGSIPVLTPAIVQEYSQEFINQSGASSEFNNLSLASSNGGSTNTAQVSLTATVHLPLVSLVVPEGIGISATGTGRSLAQF